MHSLVHSLDMLMAGCSEMNDPSCSQAPSNPENASKNVPYGRAGTPGDIAGTIIHLASRAGAHVNGQLWDVDGGVMLVANGSINAVSWVRPVWSFRRLLSLHRSLLWLVPLSIKNPSLAHSSVPWVMISS